MSATIDERLRAVFAAVFDVAPESLTDDSAPEGVPTWDSVSHVHLVLAVEEEFGIQFDPDEIPELTSFGTIRGRVGGTPGDRGIPA